MDIEKIKKTKNIKELLELGIINVDKPAGPTSFKVSEFIKKKLKLRKSSHLGTLDPMVTGVLPVALNRACKLTGYLIGNDKEYVGIARFHKKIDLKELEKIIQQKFTGIIKQTPPLKSRVKIQEREREIYSFEILEQEEKGKDFLFKVACQGGTYIRKLIHDLGKELDTGAHMLELRRTRAGIFSEEGDKFVPYRCYNMYEIENAIKEYVENENEVLLREMITPAEIITKKYPIINVKKEVIPKLYSGKKIYTEDIIEAPELKPEKVICVFSGDKFMGMYRTIMKDDLIAKAEFVLQPIEN